MPKLFNVDHQHAVIDQIESIVVAPGEPYDFTDEQVAAGIAGSWSENDPRAGLKAERQFKKQRDSRAKASPSPDETPDESSEGETTTPAEPGKEG